MGVLQSFDDLGQQRRLGRVGDVPNFMCTSAEDPQHVGLARIALGQRLAVTDAYHLRAALLVMALQPWNVREVFWLRRIGHVDDRGTVVFGLSGESVDRLRHLGRSAVMPDIGDVAAALMMDRRLIGAAAVQIIVADEPHIVGFRRISDLGRLGECGEREDHQSGSRAGSARAADRDTSLHHCFSLTALPRWDDRARRVA